MSEPLNYISDEELEQLICQVEQNDLVAAPPYLMEELLGAAEKTVVSRKKEFYTYCFRVITSVAAAVALVFLLPDFSGMVREETPVPEYYRQEAPSFEEVVGVVPAREEVVAAKNTPTKEEVLNPVGFFDGVINGTGWFDEERNKH